MDPVTPFSDRNLFRISKRLNVPCELPSSDDEVKKLAEHLVDHNCIAGPIYHSINKRLACIYFKEQNEQLAIFHLAESHGCSLRHQATYRYDRMQTEKVTEGNEIRRSLTEIVGLDGQYTLDKFQGLQNRLAELPCEWTIVQLTIQYDPMVRIIQKPTRKRNPIHLTRMFCGDLANKISSDRQGGPPISALLYPSPTSSDVLDIITTITESLDSRKFAITQIAKSDTSSQFSSKLQSLIKDFELLMRDTNCILPGNLVDSKLHRSICTQVDKIVKELTGSKKLSKSQLQVLYLLATSPVKMKSTESEILNIVIEDSCLAGKLYKAIMKLHEKYENVLNDADRHPVILILDELLDIFPIEMIDVLKNHPVSRVPSVHFAQALYREHSDTIFRSGVNRDEGYYIVNPGGDLIECEKKFRNLLQSVAPTWDGIFGVVPTESQFIDALTKKSTFLYCGHGGGNQYADTAVVERIRTKAVSFLIGCSSLKVIPLGGRVDGFSISNSYIIAGCPCTVGMLWEVTDCDANRITDYLLKRWLKPIKPSKPQSVDDVCQMVDNINLHDEHTPEPDLLRLVPLARKTAQHLRNSAALVVRGLPVKIRTNS